MSFCWEQNQIEEYDNNTKHIIFLYRKDKTEAKINALLEPGMWNMEVPGLAKEIQPTVTK